MNSSELPPTNETIPDLFIQLRESLETQFIGKNIRFDLEPYRNGSNILKVRGEQGFDDGEFHEHFKKILKEQGFLYKIRSAGNTSIDFTVDREYIDGKLNWRAWFYNPERMSNASKSILDTISGFPEITKISAASSDNIAKIDRLLLGAVQRGLITEEEESRVSYDCKMEGNLK
jgi:hypothetical protein